MRGTDAYGGEDVVRSMYGAWSLAGKMPKQVVMEGGAWQSKKVVDFLAAGVTMISAKGRPNQKLVEGFFNRLWTAMSLELPAYGQVGRFRGEMAAENKAWMRCREGRADPHQYFPTLDVFLAALDSAIEFCNADRIESRQYGNWVPRRHKAGWEAQAQPIPSGLVARSLASGSGTQGEPSGAGEGAYGIARLALRMIISFRVVSFFRFDGAAMRVRFDPYNVGAGAVLTLPRAFQEYPAGYCVAESASCISAAPDMAAVQGWLDNRGVARDIQTGIEGIGGNIDRGV